MSPLPVAERKKGFTGPGRLLPAAVLLTMTAMLSACAWMAKEAQPLSMFTDIQLPQALSVDEKNSRVFEYGYGRVGLMKASGRISRNETLEFFRTSMTQNGWTKGGEFDNNSNQMLVFNKAPRSAAITVTEGWFSTKVDINVSAKVK